MSETIIYDTKQKQLVHELIEELFSYGELDNFCTRHFRVVSSKFTFDMDDSTKIKLLVETCANQHKGLRLLVNTVKRLKPMEYERFEQGVALGDYRSSFNGEPENLLNQTVFSGRYRIDQILHKNGIGVVFKAYDTRLEIEVTVKIINLSGVQSPAMRERARQEVRTAMQLDHPGIVKIYNFRQEGPYLFIIREHIIGQNLQEARQYLQSLDRKVSLNQSLHLVRQLCFTIDYMHKNRVLHPGTQPEHIMLKNNVTSGDALWQPVFTNLGLLRPHQEIIKSGEAISPRRLMYSVSPELLVGHATDIRSDVYAMGILLYYLTVGNPPFRPHNLAEATRLHINAPPTPPRSINPNIPALVEEVILKALAKDPADRYLTAKDMAQSLAACLDMPIMSPKIADMAGIMVTSEEESAPLKVIPGEIVTRKITLHNQGEQINNCRIRAEGIPAEWVSITPTVITLPPGQEREVVITVQPPRSPQSLAQAHNLALHITEQFSSKPINASQQIVTIAPYSDFQSQLWPQEISGEQITQITLQNLGNTTENFTIRPKKSKSLTFEPAHRKLELQSGQQETVDFYVIPSKQWVGHKTKQTFSLVVASQNGRSVTHSGTVTSQPPFSTTWVMVGVIIVVLSLCGALTFLSSRFEPAWVISGRQTDTAVVYQQAKGVSTSTAKAISIDIEATNQATALAATQTATWLEQDSDGDNLTNRKEVEQYNTDPYKQDSDDDGLPDKGEIELGTDPNYYDTDFDSLSDYEEIIRDLDPLNRDTDGDSTPDGLDPAPKQPDQVSNGPFTVSFSQKPTYLELKQTGSVPIYETQENAGAAVIEVELNIPSQQRIQIDYAINDGAFNPTSNPQMGGTLIFEPGQVHLTFTIDIKDNDVENNNQKFALALINPSTGLQIGTHRAELLVIDDE